MKQVLVTGATGFIGRYFVKMLVEQEYQVSILVRSREKAKECFSEIFEKLIVYKMEDEEDSIIKIENFTRFLEKNQIECIVHLATYYIIQSSIGDTDKLIAGNITFGVQLLEAMKRAGVKNFIYTASSWQHYQNKAYCPVNLYAATKQAFEDILHYYTDAEGIHTIILEIYDTYGEEDNRNKIINIWKRAVKTKEVISLSLGEQELDYIYIEDIAAGIIRAMQLLDLVQKNDKYEKKYALSSEYSYTLKEVAAVFEQVYHTTLNIQWGDRPYRVREVMSPYREIERLPGWNIKYGLKEGFERMFQKESEKERLVLKKK